MGKYNKNNIGDVGSALKLMLKSVKEDCPILPDIEEKQLLNFIMTSKNNDEVNEAVEKVALSNMRLVVFVANKYKSYGVPIEDLIQEGYLGLIKGIRKYSDTNIKLSTYVVWWIKQSILRYICNNRNIRLPNHVVEKITKIKKTIDDFINDNGRKPKPKELVKKLGIDESEIEIILNYENNTVSLNKEVSGDGELCMEDIIPDDKNPSVEDIIEEIDKFNILIDAIDTLSEKERIVIMLRFGFRQNCKNSPYTLEEVGQVLRVTKERVRQIEVNALKKLKSILRSQI